MAYTPYYTNGWANNEAGGTPINAEALNHMEAGIKAAAEKADTVDSTAEETLKAAKEYSDTNLTAAKTYSNNNLTAAKKYSDSNLTAAKSYTDTREAVLQALIDTNASGISDLTARMGGLTFAINADDLGLDIIID